MRIAPEAEVQAGVIAQLNAILEARYAVERELGRGGMATVYLARDLRHHRRVALKLLNPELGAVVGAERFLSEIRVTASLQHPHLLPLFDSGAADGLLYYVMPYVDGESLRTRLERERQLPIDEAIRIATAVASALDHAHRHGVIHRDLKPENILLHEGQPLVADFGIALAVSNAGGHRVTQTGLSLGTPQYMSPEQAAGERSVDRRTDVFSLGAVLFEMLAGEPPHSGATVQAVIAKVLSEPARDVRMLRTSVPEHVAQAVARALAKVPADRWDTAGGLGEALRETSRVAIPRGVATPGSASALVVARASTRSRLVAIIATAAALILAGIVAWQAQSRAPVRRDLTVRFPIAIDSGLLPAVGGGIAFSPDGRLIAYVAVIGSGRVILVRPLNDVHARVLTVGGVSQLFFAPDAKSLGYVSGNTVWRIALAGGAPAQIARSETAVRGAAWTPSGDIILGTAAGLMQVPAAGGTPRLLSRSDSHRGETGQYWPIVLADGKTVVYQAASRSDAPEEARLGVASLASGASSLTTIAGACPLGVVEGQLLFSTGAGALMAVPFDVRRGRVTGEPIPVIDSLPPNAAGCIPAALSGEGSLAYEHSHSRSRVVAIDAKGNARPILTEPRAFGSPRYSPDGRRLALSIRSATGTDTDIWIYGVGAATLTRLTTEGTSNAEPDWTPDGRRVVFVSNRDGAPALWSQSADGSGPAVLLLKLESGRVSGGVLTPDGRALVYDATAGSRRADDGGGDIWWRRLDTSCGASRCDTTAKPVAVSRFFEGAARVSPDGKWVAYTSNESGDFQVYVRPFPRLDARYAVSTSRRAMAPAWSRDGRILYYLAGGGGTNELVAATIRTAPDFVVVSRTTVYRGALRGGPFGTSYDASPDGTHLVIAQPVATDEIMVIHRWAAELRARLANKVE